MIGQLGLLLAVAVGVQWLAFPVALALRTERFYDLTGSVTYLLLVGLAIGGTADLSTRGVLLAACVVVWALRLGVFLAARVHHFGRDRRFDEIKRSARRFAVAWTLQGIWVFLTPLPVWLVILRPGPGLGPLDAVGLLLWVAGFAIEVVADAQKSAFRRDPANADRFIDHGLWAWSRHPNYFGEILLWTGVFVVAASQLQGVEWLAVGSPLFVTGLLVGLSGVPLLERQAEAKWGADERYRAYVASTPVLVPRPPRGPRAG